MRGILVIDAHPNPDSLVSALARRYTEGAPGARLLALRDLDFDLNMRFGYAKRMTIEPDLADARQAIREAAHLVVVTPVWWRSVPALLKGFSDRALLPQQDYRYGALGIPQGLLTGRTARIIITSDTPLAVQPFMPGSMIRSFTHGTIAFCGYRLTGITRFGAVGSASPARRARWLDRAHALGARDARRVPASNEPATVAA